MGDHTRFSLAELAAATGMTSRNVRAYQTRGLIPPPLRIGRRSEYTTRHLEALRAIQRARAAGASLTLIARSLQPGGVIDLTGVGDGLLPADRPTDAAPTTDLTALLEDARGSDPMLQAVVDSLVAAGVAARDGRRVVAGPDVVTGLARLHRHGVPVGTALQVATRAAEAGTALAERLGELLDPRHRGVVGRHVAALAAGVLHDVLAGSLTNRSGTTGR
jgi:hypothetical protein